MDVIDDLTQVTLRQETILTIGAFDGVHRGHQALIRQVVARARATDALAALITFYPHPAMVLAPDRAPLYLTTPGEKLALFEGLQVDLVALLPFTRQLASMTALDFMTVVSKHLRLRDLWVGQDFTLGYRREGTVPRLRELGQELGYEVHVIDPVIDRANGHTVISSSQIRAFLREGQVELAAQMLGRLPSLSGEVVVGAQRGRKLGFPTANLDVRAERALPADGIYAVYAVLGNRRYPAVANVGVRPTFDDGQRIVETYILDFDDDLYGCDLVVEFVARLREERRFQSVAALIAQIEDDVERARRELSASQVPQGEPQSAGRDRLGSACPYRYEELEHTADRALRVWGQQLPDLFVGAARGMVRLMADVNGLVAAHWREIRLDALDLEALLVKWLNELLFLAEAEGLLFVDYKIELLDETALIARVGGAPSAARRTQVKAATYHNLRLLHGETGWSAVITFDV